MLSLIGRCNHAKLHPHLHRGCALVTFYFVQLKKYLLQKTYFSYLQVNFLILTTKITSSLIFGFIDCKSNLVIIDSEYFLINLLFMSLSLINKTILLNLKSLYHSA